MRSGTCIVLVLALLLTACSTAVEELAQPSGLVVAPQLTTETPTVEITSTTYPSPTPDLSSVRTVSYRGIRMQYDRSIASTVRGAVVPAMQGHTPDLDIPEHLRFIFDEIALSSVPDPREPQLLIFPIDDFRLLDSKRADTLLDALNELLIEKPLDLNQQIQLMPQITGEAIAQIHARYLRFAHGEGVRFLTAYSDETGALHNESLFYTFQGLSSDKKFYISMFFPVEIQETLNTSEQDTSGEDSITAEDKQEEDPFDWVNLLEKMPDRSFSPNLNLLDSMIKSLELPDLNLPLIQVSDPEKVADRIRRERKAGLHALWRELGISSTLFDPPSELNLELFEMEVDGSQDEYHLLLISDSIGKDWQYLLFRSAANRWLFVGQVDLAEQEFLPPACRMVNDKGKTWWVISWLDDTGPGFTHYRETWYSFKEGPLRAVLSFPIEGYQISDKYAYNVTYQANISMEEETETSSIRLSYHLSYTIYGDGEDKTVETETYKLLEMQRSALYVWNDQEHKFSLIPEASNLSQDQIDAVFYFPGPESTFLQFASQELMLVARNGTPLQKRWLKQFLDSLEASLDVEEFKTQIGG